MSQAVILAGGRGTRLAEKLGDNPKPMVPLAGKPLLEYQIELARRYGFQDVLLLSGYRSEKLVEHFRDGAAWGVRLEHLIESEPLGTAGALLAAYPRLAERFLLLYGDTMLDVDLARMWQAHAERGAGLTLFVHPNDHPADSDLVEADAEGWVRALHPYPHAAGACHQNLVNAALYVMDKEVLAPWASQTIKWDIAKRLIPQLLEGGCRVLAYRSREYIKDVGTPERLARVEADYLAGKVAARGQACPCPAVFLDRDGTLNREMNRVTQPAELELLPGVARAIRRLNQAGWLAVVTTNQPVIARGDCSELELRRIHDKLETLLGAEGAFLDGLYYCPHHPDKGFAGERPELKIECDCRKPKTGLLQTAHRDLNIDFSRSWFVGDSTVDLRCARQAGVRGALVRTGHAGQDGTFPERPDFEFADLGAAVDFILGASPGPNAL